MLQWQAPPLVKKPPQSTDWWTREGEEVGGVASDILFHRRRAGMRGSQVRKHIFVK